MPFFACFSVLGLTAVPILQHASFQQIPLMMTFCSCVPLEDAVCLDPPFECAFQISCHFSSLTQPWLCQRSLFMEYVNLYAGVMTKCPHLSETRYLGTKIHWILQLCRKHCLLDPKYMICFCFYSIVVFFWSLPRSMVQVYQVTVFLSCIPRSLHWQQHKVHTY